MDPSFARNVLRPNPERLAPLPTKSARLFAVLLGFASLAAVPARAGLLISELCDPLSHFETDRFIEIYNSGPAAVDLTGWKIVAMANTSPATEPLTWNLSGTILPGEAKVAGYTAPFTGFPVHFPDPNWYSNPSNSTGAAFNWNGKAGDGAKLINPNSAIVDIVVATGDLFNDKDYVRNPGVTDPSPTYNPSQWTATPVTLATNASPGTHNGGTPPPMVPVISGIVTIPAFPMSGEAVDVQANVTDSVAAITSVSLNWGTTSSSLPNSIAMALLSGNTYQTSSQIPAPGAGVTVYYKVTATDAVANTNSSAVLSFSAPQNLTIAQIQGVGTASPYNGMSAITQGVVTSVFGALFTIQDGAGTRSGLWVRGTGSAPAIGDVVTVRGTVTESDPLGLANNTLLSSATITATTPGGTLPTAEVVTTANAQTENYEGVLVRVLSATCSSANPGGTWVVNDGSGGLTVDRLGGYSFEPTTTNAYHVTGTVTFTASSFRLEPRTNADIVFAGDASAPTILSVGETSDSTLLVFFSEPVQEASAEVASNYAVGALVAVAAERDPAHPEQVSVTVRNLTAGPRTMTATGVEDLGGNPTGGTSKGFVYVDVSIPAGYYNGTAGLRGSPLRVALHNLIKNHTDIGYGGAQDAFAITDIKPSGKIWDMYSDVPGGTPPYEYDVDDLGQGATEGLGYNREHSFPQSWFNEANPMHNDLWNLYPTDSKVNGYRSNWAYGEVSSPTITSWNGSKVGPNVTPGFSGTVFEPLDPYKGDLARSQFYMATRYFGQDAGWGTESDSFTGANPKPWAAELYLQWVTNDPVSWKERYRNGAVFTYQNKRNPFIDHPEFVALIWDSTSAVGVEPALPRVAALRQSSPNPFGLRTSIRFDLPRRDRVSLRVYDVTGRVVRTLSNGVIEAGSHQATWDGRNDAGTLLEAGLYFCRLDAGSVSETRRMVFAK